MKITGIKPQVKRPGRYSIFVDDKFVFGLSELGLIDSGLKIGQELSKTEIEHLKGEAKTDKAYNQVLNLLARRARSLWEIEQYLKRKDYEEEIIKIILNKLSDRGLVDDLAFAKAWVDNRRLLKSTSKRRLKLELRQKRLPTDIIDQVLSEDETSDQTVLRELVARKKERYPDKLKFMRYLAAQGYNYDDIKSVLEETN